MEDLDFLTTYLSPRQIKKLNKQSKKEKTKTETLSKFRINTGRDEQQLIKANPISRAVLLE